MPTLITNIRAAVAEIQQDMIERAVHSLIRRLNAIIENGGERVS